MSQSMGLDLTQFHSLTDMRKDAQIELKTNTN